jgi:ATP phosphoribosyltransferase
LDVAVIGDDWVTEECSNANRNKVKRVGDLEYGETRLVIAVPKDAPYGSLSDFFLAMKGRRKPVLCFTEYTNLTRETFMRNETYRRIHGDKKPIVRVRGLRDGENMSVQIINSDGVTEGYIAKGADMIVDNTQSGRKLKEYGLRELEQIMRSTAGLYAGPGCVGWKEGKAVEIFELMHGAVVGKKYCRVEFNVPVADSDIVREHLISKGLCANEPTITRGREYAQVDILIPVGRYPEIYGKLRRNYHATAIVKCKPGQVIF